MTEEKGKGASPVVAIAGLFGREPKGMLQTTSEPERTQPLRLRELVVCPFSQEEQQKKASKDEAGRPGRSYIVDGRPGERESE